MAQISYIKYRELDLGDRIDAEFFRPDYLKIERKILSQKFSLLNQIARLDTSAFYPAATHLYNDGTIPFVRCVDCINYPLLEQTRLGEYEKIPEFFLNDNNKFIKKIHRNDIVITKVGTPSYASIVYNFNEMALSRTVLGLSEIKINPFYLT